MIMNFRRLFPTSILSGLIAAVLAAPTAAAPAGDRVLVVEGRLIDGTGAAAIDDGRVVVRGERIVCAGPRRACKAPRGAEVLAVKKGAILPGLIDLHVHPRAHYLSWWLPAGVTAVRVALAGPEDIARLETVGPHRPEIVWAGPLIDGERTIMARAMKGWGFSEEEIAASVRRPDGRPLTGEAVLIVTTEAEARAAVDDIVRAGADWVKLYEQLPPDLYRAAAARARELGKPVMTDLGMVMTRGVNGSEVDVFQALEAGVDTLEHVGGMALAYARMGGDPTAPELDPALIDRMARAIRDSGATLVPTLAMHVWSDRGEAPDLKAEALPMADMDDRVARDLHEGWEAIRRDESTRVEAAADRRMGAAVVRRLHELGGRVAVGTDTPAAAYTLPGGMVHKEMEVLVQLGFTPLEAIAAATGESARALHRDDIGVIAAGRRADLVLVEGRPDADIRDTRRIRAVVQAGRALSLDALRDQALKAGELTPGG